MNSVSDDFDTGVAEIDDIETTFANSIKLFMDPGGIGDFTVGEEVVGDEFLAKATATLSGDSVDGITITDGGALQCCSSTISNYYRGGGMEQQQLLRLIRLVLLMVLVTNGGQVIQLSLLLLLTTHLKTTEQKSSPGIAQPEFPPSSKQNRNVYNR